MEHGNHSTVSGADLGCGHGAVSGLITGGAGKESVTNGAALWKRVQD